MLLKEAQKNYISAILNQKNVPEKFVPVMDAVLDTAHFDADSHCMEFISNAYVKKRIAKKIGLKSPGPVNSGLAKLEEVNLVCCIENGVYHLNPQYFGSRPWAEVTSACISYMFDEKTEIQMQLKYHDEVEVLREDPNFGLIKDTENEDDEFEDSEEEAVYGQACTPASITTMGLTVGDPSEARYPAQSTSFCTSSAPKYDGDIDAAMGSSKTRKEAQPAEQSVSFGGGTSADISSYDSASCSLKTENGEDDFMPIPDLDDEL